MSSSRIHCCYIITGTEFKEEHILEQDELFCCVIISCGLKEKMFVLFASWRTPDPFLIPGDPGLLFNLRTDSHFPLFLLGGLFAKEKGWCFHSITTSCWDGALSLNC